VAAPGAARPQLLPEAHRHHWSQGGSLRIHALEERRTEQETQSAWDLLWRRSCPSLLTWTRRWAVSTDSLLRDRLHSLQRSLGTAAVCSLLTAILLTSAPPGFALTQVLEALTVLAAALLCLAQQCALEWRNLSLLCSLDWSQTGPWSFGLIALQAPPRKLLPDEIATVKLFNESTPSVVYITNLAVR